MDDLWNFLRVLNLCILFLSFLIGTYKGVFRVTTMKYAFKWDRFMNMVWSVLSIFAIGEILYQSDVPGGTRIALTTLVCLVQLWVVMFKYEVDERKPESRA